MRMPAWLRRLAAWPPVALLVGTAKAFGARKAPRMGAALAYYAVFSIAPLLVIALAVAGSVFGEEAARGELFGTVGGLVGEGGAEAIEAMVAAAWQPRAGALAVMLGVVALLFGATNVFTHLKESIEEVWGVASQARGGWRGALTDRFASFAMVMGIAFLLLVSLVVTALLAAAGGWVAARMPGGALFWQAVNFVVGLAVVAALFALTFRLVPEARVGWPAAWAGGLFTAVLFSLGKWLIGLYLGRSAVADVYGAAGSLVIVLLWVYFNAQIVLLGAAFTREYASLRGERIVARPQGARAARRASGARRPQA